MSNLISYKDISISLSGRLILSIDQLAIPFRQCTLLTGRNGSGKTTLLKIMSGLLKPDSARIDYQGLNLSWRQAKPYIQKDTIYLHQQPYLFDSTVFNNIAYGLYRNGENKTSVHKKVNQALEWANLSHLAHQPANSLSGGEKQRVALTRARILSPSLLLLDEPTASMDSESKQQTSLLLQRLNAEGLTIIISSHESHTVSHLIDRHLHLENGRMKEINNASQNNKVTPFKTTKNTLTNE